MKIIITILAAVVIIDALIVYACCVVASRADEAAECIARNIRAMGLDYFGYYHGTNPNKYEWKVRHDRS